MGGLTRQTTTNPLIQRVRRHQALTTLFQLGQPSVSAALPVQRQATTPATQPAFVMGIAPEELSESTLDTEPAAGAQEWIEAEGSENQAVIPLPTAPMATEPSVQRPIAATQRQVASPPKATSIVPAKPQPTQPVPPTVRSQAPQPSAPTMRHAAAPTQTTASQRPASVPLDEAAQAVQRTSEPVATPTPSAPPTTAAMRTAEDRSWARLEAIMAAHRRKENEQEMALPSAQPVTTPTQSQGQINPMETPKAASSRQPLAKGEATGKRQTQVPSAETNTTLQRSVAPSPSSQQDNAAKVAGDSPVYKEQEADGSQANEPPANTTVARKTTEALPPEATARTTQKQTASPIVAEQPTAMFSAQAGQQSTEPATRPEDVSLQPLHQATNLLAREEQPETKQQPKQAHSTKASRATPVPLVQKAARGEQGDEAPPPLPFSEADSSIAPGNQPLPLQEAWPGVQRIVNLSDEDDANLPADELPDGQPTDRQPVAFTERATISTAVQTALSHVETAQPTESTVHVIPPRRPRPRVQRNGINKAADPGITAKSSVAPTAQQKVSDVEGQNEIPVKQVNNQTPEPVAAETTFVETEIGALPNDLWRLIGEPVPVQAPQPEAANNPTQGQTGQAVPTIQAKRLAPSPSLTANHVAETTQPSVSGNTKATRIDKAALSPEIKDEEPRLDQTLSGGHTPHAQTPDVRSSVMMQAEQQQVDELYEPVAENNSQAIQDNSVDEQARNRSSHSRANDLGIQRKAAQAKSPSSSISTPAVLEPAPLSTLEATQETSVVATQSQTNKVLQRQVDEVAPETNNASHPAVADTVSTGESTPTSKVDTDELAREVYAKLRRRLGVEQERLGF